MAAYAALLSLAQTTDLSVNQDKQYRFTFDAESNIRSIHEYVNFLLSFLKNFPENATRWEDKVRVVAHKIEDIIQHYMWQQMNSMKPSRMIFRDQLKDIAEEIGLIVGQMMEERPAYLPAAAVSVSSPATTGKDAVIGLHADVKAIKDRLCGHSSKLQVFPIVGMGGIGKTTLARTVYDDPLIFYHFDIRAWVTVSQDHSPHKLRKILLGLADSVKLFEKGLFEETIEESKLKLKVYQSLKGRRYLIVMDDVWRTDVWDDLRNVFPNANIGSRIMLTTRLSDLANYPDFGSPLHEMRIMDDHQSWDLLKLKVFTNSTNFPPELEDIGKDIARKCAGLPLAVVLVAGVLSAANTNQAFWEEIARNVNHVVKEELEEILSFSYTHLPHHLRPCFLYIGGFPEDEEIHASTLIKLWVAEGFLKHQFGCSKSLEDEAEVYLDDLVKRNLLLVNSRKTNGKIKSCSLHDTVRDMCVRKAREEKFHRVLDGCVLSQGVMNERRISFNRSDIDGILGPTSRSILCFQLQSFDGWEAFLRSSTLLKVLNGVGIINAKYKSPVPSRVFDLIHLTHLVLIGSFNIPSAISNLVNLQTLIIHPTFHLRKRNWRDNYKNAYHFSLPLEIWRMWQLRHLILYDLYMLPPPPDGSNLPLEKLQLFSPLENLVWSERMVQMIPNVKKLGLVYSSNKEYHLHLLDCLHQLKKLQITGYKDFSWRGQNLAFSTTLQKLSLVGVKFPWEDMSIIGSLPNLQVLKLLNHACHGETWETDDGEFPQLTFLLIDTSRLRQWTTQGSSSFPMLRCLVLHSCADLQEIPESIGEIPTLELIEVYYCGWSLVELVEKIREDQESYGNDALQVRVIYSDEVRVLPSYSVAAYDALLSLAQTTNLCVNQDNQYRFSVVAESKIRSIHEYVIFLLSFLENFPKKATRWEHKVREVARKIEDVIQHYMWQKMKSMRASSVIFEGLLKKLTEDIGLIVGQMMEERPAYLPVAAISISSPVTTGKDAVIGLQDDVMAIKDRLCGQSSKLQVIPIVGMGGIGKTTLARTVYDDQLIHDYFDIRAWLTISRDYNLRNCRKILLDLADSVKLSGKEFFLQKIHESGEGELQLLETVYQWLEGKRYLIVIDDVWRKDVWNYLRNVFPNDNNGSRIMLTTRLLDVATYPDFRSPLHEMQFMDDHQSWDLLKQKVFTNNSNFPPELEDIGKEITRKCAGLPLAIVLVAGVLSAANTSQAFWKEIAGNVNPIVKEELEEILSLSYTHLPYHLRPCFLYIGGFPEDEEIHASRLIKLWVAEGFLKHQFGCSRSLEDEAEVYLDDLVKRNLVLVTSRKTNGKIKSCGLHDTIRDMCVRKACEEKFLRVLDGRYLPQSTINERRISFNHSDINGIFGPTIRSILCFQLQSFDGWEAFLWSSTLLKVLNGVGSRGKDQPPIPSQVFDLFHLTHLVLIGSFHIPSAISNLVNLQTLIIHPTFHLRKRKWRYNYKIASHFSLPLEIWRMRKIRHLILYDLYTLPPPPDGSNLSLEKLQTLSPLENLVWSGRMVQMIPNVKKLVLVYSSNEEYHLHHLDCLHQLEKLQIAGYQDFSWRGKNLAFSTTLQKLSLVDVKFPWEDMGIIGSLPNLQVLKLLNHACDGETWETDDEEFPQLKFLLIDRSHLRQWTTHGSSSFRMLRCLVLRYCTYLEEIPEGIGDILTLELIQVDYCTRSLVESVEHIRKDQQDYRNNGLQVRVIHSNKGKRNPLLISLSHFAQNVVNILAKINVGDLQRLIQKPVMQTLISVRNAIQSGSGGGRRAIHQIGGAVGEIGVIPLLWFCMINFLMMVVCKENEIFIICFHLLLLAFSFLDIY